MGSKYHNRRFAIGDEVFDSSKEYIRFSFLKALENTGQISDLQRQVRFDLIPKQQGERAVYYVADFVYNLDGNTVVEDVKGYKTKDYIIKRKLMLYIHGIKIQEV